MPKISIPPKLTFSVRQNTLSFSSVEEPPSGWELEYTWYRDDEAFSNGGKEYQVMPSDWGHLFKIGVRWSRGLHRSEEILSEKIHMDLSDFVSAPVLRYSLENMTLFTEGMSRLPRGVYLTLSWYRDGKERYVPVGSTYDLRPQDLGHTFKVMADYTLGEGAQFVKKTSRELLPEMWNPLRPRLAFDTLRQSVLVTLSDAPRGWLRMIKWYRSGVPIPGAIMMPYDFTSDDLAQPLTLTVKYKKGVHTTTVMSDTLTQNPLISKPEIFFDEFLHRVEMTSSVMPPAGWIREWSWYRNGVEVPGIRAAEYHFTDVDWGARISGALSLVRSDGKERFGGVFSDELAPVLPIPEAPKLTFDKEHRSMDITLPKPPKGWHSVVEWYRNGASIEVSDTLSYRVGLSDYGRDLHVGLRFVKGIQISVEVPSKPLQPELPEDRCLAILEGHTDYVYSVAFSPDGNQVVSGSNDHMVYVWNITDSLIHPVAFSGHNDAVNAVAFSPDGSQVISGSSDHTLKLWDVSQGELLNTFSSWRGGWVYAVHFSPDGREVVSASWDGALRFWGVETDTLLRKLSGHIDPAYALDFGSENVLISGGADRRLKFWSPDSLHPIHNVFMDSGEGGVTSLAVSPDRAALVVGTSGIWSGSARILNLLDHRLVHTFTEDEGSVESVAFAPRGAYVASGSDDVVRIWSVSDGDLMYTFEKDMGWVNALSFSPDGRYLISGSEDNKIRLWYVGDFLE